ncbi:ABC transporter ATP-binding protein [Desulfovibrio inopinatus]|uniref:ABC transporter ATP-binding protein n=1 Tax=Desulfovibrio inopinatus TaxID=102109 RepID=UPI0004229250|nr:ABC transporter ATP-binding protein [Desulfovibrio inopinatus]
MKKQQKSRKSEEFAILKRSLRLFFNYKKKIIIIIICLGAYVGIAFLIPILNKLIIDQGILEKNYANVLYCALGIVILGVLHAVVGIVQEQLRISIYIDVYRRLIVEVFQALLHIRVQFFKTKNSTDIFNDLEVDTTNILSLFGKHIFFAVTQLAMFLGGLVGLFIIEHRLAVIVLMFIPAKYALVNFLARKRKASIADLIQAKTRFAHWFGDAVQGIKDIRLFGLSDTWEEHLQETITPLTASQKKLAILDSSNESIERAMVEVLIGVLYAIGAYLILNDSLTMGTLFALITYSMYVMDPISSLLNIHYSLSGVIPSALRYYRFMDMAAKERETSGDSPISSIDTIVFSHVSFSHTDTPVLSNINFSIHKGEKVAIVGQNGAGKSTLLGLIQKFYEPDSGTIYINGVDLVEIEKKSYRESLSCINQDSYLFDIDLLENIRLYKDVSEEQILLALSQSRAMDFFKGKETSTPGQNGGKLSSGQRQKILLARLLLNKAKVYLLDEATSNLDVDSENAIMKLMETTLKDETVILITHKIELLRNIHKILYLKGDGSLIVYDSYEAMYQHQYENLSAMQRVSES